MARIDTLTAWQAVLDRDRRFDGRFVYAVSSTRVYCRPVCPSRRPARHRVSFFLSAQQAEAAGFRPCLRCQPNSPGSSPRDRRIERARQYLDDHPGETVTLHRLASHAGLSPFHLQRAFRQTVGLSPKAYQNARRIDRFTALLKTGVGVTHAAYESGFGSSSHAAEQASDALGMTPSAYRSGGKGLYLRYAAMRTPVGQALIAGTERGIVSVSLGTSDALLLAALKETYPHALLRHDPQGLKPHLQTLHRYFDGQDISRAFALDVQATAFQRTVWRALQAIPQGSTKTYRDIACEIGQPSAARAVARACATNPIAVVVPCHRVVRKDGSPSGYRWGLERKTSLLALERERKEARATQYPDP
ncbi:MAG: bifunctional DNA-binding transcriptional regulator/O6-methylguanine-DNA methyltransferase Ada [Nitrospira sp.]|nr:bifunctional DNA-binding transcriptional regulator/O6-methylguanine-DNA methyltransferase Ada [Nitrospira sp.]